MPPLLRELLRPYRGSLAIILAATLVSMLVSLTVPWPLKVILDNVAGSHPRPHQDLRRLLARNARPTPRRRQRSAAHRPITQETPA